jgi:hypothetical protein
MPRTEQEKGQVSQVLRGLDLIIEIIEGGFVVTQEQVNTAFGMGEDRMFDVNELIEEGMIGDAELVGMLVGALKCYATRTERSITDVGQEIIDLFKDEDE